MKKGCDQAGAYGIVRDDKNHILLVQANTGRFYLPGGRIESFETPEEALVREIREECGWSGSVLERLGEAIQPIFGGRVSLLATYWRVELNARAHDRPEHRMVWLPGPEAAARLHRQSDVAILRQVTPKGAQA